MTKGNSALGFQMKQFLVNGLKARGFKGDAEAAAAGIMGNLAVESGNFDPNVIAGKRKGDNGVATGLAQWHPNRWEPLEQWSKSQGMDPYTWQAQLNMILYEMTEGPEKASWRALETARSPAEASEIFMAKYERPFRENKNDITTTSHYEDRVQWAKNFSGQSTAMTGDERMSATAATTAQSGYMGFGAPGSDMGFNPMGPSQGGEMDMSQYTEQEKDFLMSMNLFKAARNNMPKLIQLDNLLAD